MSIAIQADPVPLKIDEDGTIRVGGTRMTLDLIIAEHRAGASPEQIAAVTSSVDITSTPRWFNLPVTPPSPETAPSISTSFSGGSTIAKFAYPGMSLAGFAPKSFE